MRRSAIVAGGVGLLALIIWAIYPSGPEAREAVKPAEKPSTVLNAPAPDVAPVREHEVEDEEQEPDAPPPSGKLDPNSKEFFERVDDIIPAKLYTAAAEACWNPTLPKDPKIKLWLKLRAVDGQILVWDIKVMKSTIKDQGLADCIVHAVKNASWRDEEMPDWEDEDELLIRLGGMKKHVEDQGGDEEGTWPAGSDPED